MTRFLVRSLPWQAAILAMASLAGAVAGPVQAEDQPAKAVASATEEPMFEGAPIPDGELAATTGRENSTLLNASANNSAIVANNRVGDNSRTGDVNVTDSAFQNVSGISMVNFNSGNNSSINAAMSINLQINYAQPTPP